MLEVDVLLTEAKLTEQFLQSLEQRTLPEKFFYWFPLSVKAWLDLCQASQPYKNYSRSYQLVLKHAPEVAEQCAGEKIQVVGLGAGQGDKDLLALEALRSKGKAVRYLAVDSSQSLLEIALARANIQRFAARGLKADMENSLTFRQLASSAEEPRLYLLLGNSMGITDPLQLLTSLGKLLREEDRVLLDGEIYSGSVTLQGYDNPVNRRFAFAPLASLGLEEGRDGTLVFESAVDSRQEGLHLVRKHFRPARRLRLSVAGKLLELEENQKIDMNPSWKYSAATFLKLLRENGGLEILQEYPAADGNFVMVYASREDTTREKQTCGDQPAR